MTSNPEPLARQLPCQRQNLSAYATSPGRVANGLCHGPDSVPADVDPKRGATPTVLCHVGIRALDRTRQYPEGTRLISHK
jgi:hypothetical protein